MAHELAMQGRPEGRLASCYRLFLNCFLSIRHFPGVLFQKLRPGLEAQEVVAVIARLHRVASRCIALHRASLAAGLGSDTVALLGADPVSAWTPANVAFCSCLLPQS
eukprot:s315_g13.t1